VSFARKRFVGDDLAGGDAAWGGAVWGDGSSIALD